LLIKTVKNKLKPLLRRQYWYPHNVISQGAVVADQTLLEKNGITVIFDPGSIQLQRERVEYEYGSIAVVKAVCQELIQVQSVESPKPEEIWQGSVEKGEVSRS
jgi:hypothetical protein